MQWTDYILSIALIALVVRQIRGRLLSLVGLLWPIGLVLWAVVEYGTDVPPGAADRALVIGLSCTGIALGTACGVLTRVYPKGAVIFARAGVGATTFWIIGVSGRLIFGAIAQNGGGAGIARLSSKIGLESPTVWAPALIFMALLEVASRTFVLFVKLTRERRALRARGVEPARSTARSDRCRDSRTLRRFTTQNRHERGQ